MLKRIQHLNRNLFFRIFYLGKPPWETGITPPELEEFIASHPPGRALDLGCGTGTNAITLAAHGWQVTGVDFVPKAIRQARRKARAAGLEIEFHIGDVTDPAHFKGQYDLIYDIGCYHIIDPADRARYQNLVAEHLSPGGSYMLYGFYSPTGDQISETDLAAFQALLTLTRREDGFDQGEKGSVWLWFESRA